MAAAVVVVVVIVEIVGERGMGGGRGGVDSGR